MIFKTWVNVIIIIIFYYCFVIIFLKFLFNIAMRIILTWMAFRNFWQKLWKILKQSSSLKVATSSQKNSAMSTRSRSISETLLFSMFSSNWASWKQKPNLVIFHNYLASYSLITQMSLIMNKSTEAENVLVKIPSCAAWLPRRLRPAVQSNDDIWHRGFWLPG